MTFVVEPAAAPRNDNLVSPSLRTGSWVLAAVLAVLVVVGAFLASGASASGSVEARFKIALLAQVHNTLGWRSVFHTIVPNGVAVVGVLFLAWTVLTRSWRGLVACAAIPLSIALTESAAKPLVGRAYPSGHVALVAATGTVLIVLVGSRFQTVAATMAGLFVAVPACVGTAIAAMVTGGHELLDVIGGLAIGTALTLAWALLIDVLAKIRAAP